jgi:beta-lactamase class A
MIRASLAFGLAAALLVSLAARAAAAAEPDSREAALFDKLRARLEVADRSLDGLLGVSVKDLKTGTLVEVRASEVFPAASTIKAAVLYELYLRAEQGQIDLGEVTQPPLPRVGGDGALQLLSDRVSLTWRDLAALMFAFSDNEAANVLVRRLGLETVNKRLDALGLGKTRLRRLMMDTSAARSGQENVSTPAELRTLLEALRTGAGLSPARAKDLQAVASLAKTSPFRSGLPAALSVSDKPGDLPGVRCVGATVELPGRPYAVAIMTSYLRRDEDGDEAIRAISRALFETFDRLARSSEFGRGFDEP